MQHTTIPRKIDKEILTLIKIPMNTLSSHLC